MDKSKQMSMIKILDINAPFIREASSANFEEDLNHEIETKLAGLEVKGLPYERADIIELISSIETEKMRCLEGEISATQLYHYVEHALRTFKLRHPKFHYMEDPAFRLYYS